MLFASLIIEREPLDLALLPVAVLAWLRDAGGLAAFGLVIFAIAYVIQRPAWTAQQKWSARATAFLTLFASAAVLYVAFALLLLIQGRPATAPVNPGPNQPIPETIYTPLQNLVLTLAGGLAIAAVLVPILIDFAARFRWRRVWAMARLSIKEAMSKGVVWVALIIPLIYLYSDWYLVPTHPKDQLAQRVKVVYFALTWLFVVSALLIGSFSIPTDVKSQTIHTIVTKPVERYEIVLGRFVGCALLLLAELLLLTGISLAYVRRGLSPEAEEESLHARVPLFAEQLGFWGTRGESVGREWNYRKYFGSLNPQGGIKQYGVWLFQHIPGALADPQGPVRVEYSFDIFRTTKADEKIQGVKCTFTFAPGNLSVPDVERLVNQVEQLRTREGKGSEALAEEYGVYVARDVRVADYHTLPLDVPAGLFRKLYQDQGKAAAKGDGTPAAALQVLVNLEARSGPQMLGVARRDLYILAGDRPFWLNFLKGSLGLWFMACLVLGIAITCSTYLSGVISLLVTAFLCGAGLFKGYIRELAFGQAVGGGPFEAAYRLANRRNMAIQLDKSNTTVNVLQGLDEAYRWYLRRVLNVIPDVTRFDLTTYVASGFDVSWGQVLFADTFVPLLGYLIPCGILAYYLMNAREIANPT
jgi:ABC-type transport system involved in multi-copper enzyme maturation permease subunit